MISINMFNSTVLNSFKENFPCVNIVYTMFGYIDTKSRFIRPSKQAADTKFVSRELDILCVNGLNVFKLDGACALFDMT